MSQAYFSGLSLGFGLILAIGAQNAFVLRQGLRREHVFAVCLACALSDAVLIAIGVAGFGVISSAAPWVEPVFRYGGAAFLVAYGFRSLRMAWTGAAALVPSQTAAGGVRRAVGIALVLTWANPHVYLDTVVLLGSIATQYPGREGAFAGGAITASFAFFFALGYGARLVRPLFARPRAWSVLELLVAVVMFSLAAKLVLGD